MPKKVRLILNIVFTLILLICLITKAVILISRWDKVNEIWEFDKEMTDPRPMFYVFGVFPAIVLTALSIWLRGVAPIVISAISGMEVFGLFCFEMLFFSLFNALEADIYVGTDPLISAATHAVSIFVLIISIVDLVLNKKKKKAEAEYYVRFR